MFALTRMCLPKEMFIIILGDDGAGERIDPQRRRLDIEVDV